LQGVGKCITGEGKINIISQSRLEDDGFEVAYSGRHGYHCVKGSTESERKRKRTSNVSYFKAPWRGDNIHKHMKEQHNVKHAEYLEAPAEVRKSFFDSTDATFLPLRAANDTVNMLVDEKIV